MDIGKLHVLVLHFPIALVMSALLADLLRLVWKSDFFKHAAVFCLVLAVLSAVPAVITGLAKARSQEFVGDYRSIVVIHQWLGIMSLVLGTIIVVIRLLKRERLEKIWAVGYYILLFLLAAIIAATGHYGGMLVHGKDFLSNLF